MKKHRIGRFFVTDMLLKDAESYAHFFAGLVVLRAEHDWCFRRVEYVAWSAQFDVAPEGELIPEYRCEFDSLTGAVSWKRVAQ